MLAGLLPGSSFLPGLTDGGCLSVPSHGSEWECAAEQQKEMRPQLLRCSPKTKALWWLISFINWAGFEMLETYLWVCLSLSGCFQRCLTDGKTTLNIRRHHFMGWSSQAIVDVKWLCTLPFCHSVPCNHVFRTTVEWAKTNFSLNAFVRYPLQRRMRTPLSSFLS